jgi:surface carbohydrate biosynthesis protein
MTADVTTPRRWLVLPIETKAREFHAKTLLAATVAERGIDVVLGEQNALLAQRAQLPRALYIDKSVARTKEAHFKALREAGSLVAAWCEEGLVYRDREAYLRERVHAPSLALAARFYAWGPVQGADMREYVPTEAAKVVETGNPRLDLLRPELRGFYTAEVEALDRRLGPYILVNTNFSRYNHHLGQNSWIEGLKRRGTLTTPEQEAFYFGWRDFLGRIHHAFVDLLPHLATAFPEHRIVVRPHPSENHAPWHQAAQPLGNVEVHHEGPVVPWLLGAEAVIHNSCTTGLEAHLLGRPVAAYRPALSEIYDSDLPNAVSHNAETADDLIDLVRGLIARPRAADGANRAALAYLAGLEGALAVDALAADIDTLDLPECGFAAGPAAAAARLAARIATAARPLARRLLKGGLASAYVDQKFPGIDLTEVRAALAGLQSATGRFTTVRAEALGLHHAYRITAR